MRVSPAKRKRLPDHHSANGQNLSQPVRESVAGKNQFTGAQCELRPAGIIGQVTGDRHPELVVVGIAG